MIKQKNITDIEEIVFGDKCFWCARTAACDCHNLPEDLKLTQEEYDAKCKCSCGRCTFDIDRPEF